LDRSKDEIEDEGEMELAVEMKMDGGLETKWIVGSQKTAWVTGREQMDGMDMTGWRTEESK